MPCFQRVARERKTTGDPSFSDAKNDESVAIGDFRNPRRLGGVVIGGELLVRGASRLAAAIKISPLVIGLTVVAFGTSSPELAVSIQSAFAGNADIALGNVVGSNIFNVLFILGTSALIVPLVVSSRLIRWDVPLMIMASILLLLLGLDGKIGRLEGFLLFGGAIGLHLLVRATKSRESSEVKGEFAQQAPGTKANGKATLVQLGLIMAGLLLLGLGSHWLIGGSVFVATHLGVSELVIGLTIIAAGTSLPEVVTSIMAAWRGERTLLSEMSSAAIFSTSSAPWFGEDSVSKWCREAPCASGVRIAVLHKLAGKHE